MKEEICCRVEELHPESIRLASVKMPEEDDLFALADLYKIFGDSTRLHILFVLFENELCVCDIARLCNMTVSAISHQLRLLKQFRLVKYRKDGKSVFYSLADDHVHSILGQGIDHLQEEL